MAGSIDRARFVSVARFAVVFADVQRIEFSSGADGIDVALREHRAQPGFQRTAPVEITEQRAAASFSSGDAVKVGKKGVGQVDRRGVLGRSPQNCRSSNPEVATEFSHEIIPGAFRSVAAGTCQGQIAYMHSGKIFVNPLDGRSGFAKALGGTSGQCRVKRLEGELPALGGRFGKELLGHGAASVRNAPGARLAAIRRLILVAVGHLETEGGVFQCDGQIKLARRRLGNLAAGTASTYTDRKSTRLNSSHTVISYAVFCLKKEK